MPPTPAAGCRGAARPSARRGAPFAARLDVLLQDAALVAAALHLAEIDAELARELAHAGTGVGERERGFVDRAGGSLRAGAGAAAGAVAGAAAAAAAAGAAPRPPPRAALSVTSVSTSAPSDTLSPTLTAMS